MTRSPLADAEHEPDSSAQPKPPLALIAGPTASGKSDYALALARHLTSLERKAAIINADSAQVYRDLAVLSARPAAEEMAEVPHFLYGEWDGAEPCSAADWARRAKAVIADLHRRDTVPILVGGTGMYLRVLLDGIAPVPSIPDAIRDAVRAMPQAEARAALEREDPGAAARLAPADSARTSRALEVVRASGRPLSAWQAEKRGGIGNQVTLAPALLMPDREWVYARCDGRFTKMLSEGAVEEVEALAARNLSPDLPVMRAIGVREIMAWLNAEISREDMITAASQATRNYAKRQYTWFRGQAPASWPRLSAVPTMQRDWQTANAMQEVSDNDLWRTPFASIL